MILGVIPARGGSKGIPRKNIKTINGKPLISWSIESALKSELLDEFVVSTEDDEIAQVAESLGSKVHRRPDHLATDEARTIDVLKQLAQDYPGATEFVVLQPTSPLRDDNLIDECIREYRASGCENLATGFYCKYQEFGTHNNVRRQDYQGFFYDDGNVYVISRALVVAGKWSGTAIARKVIARHQNYEIDDEVDFHILESLLQADFKK